MQRRMLIALGLFWLVLWEPIWAQPPNPQSNAPPQLILPPEFLPMAETPPNATGARRDALRQSQERLNPARPAPPTRPGSNVGKARDSTGTTPALNKIPKEPTRTDAATKLSDRIEPFEPFELAAPQAPLAYMIEDPLDVIDRGSTRVITPEQAVTVALDLNQYLNVLRYRQPLWDTRVEEALAPFDPVIELGQIFEERSSPLTSNITAAGTTATSQLRQTLDPPDEQDDNISYSRRTSDGSVVQLNYSNRYERLAPAGDFRVVNPAWNSGISLAVRKPLLRGAGTAANFAKANINREFYHRAGWDVRQAMNVLARTVRRAYWDLDLAYRLLDIQTRASEWARETAEREEKRFKIGSGTRADVAQAKELYQRYRIMELEAKANLLQQERRFRRMMGIRDFDDSVFATELNAAPEMVNVDWEVALSQAIGGRPDLAAQRHHIQAYRHEVGLRENETLPDFALLGRVSVGGLDNELHRSVEDMFDAEGSGWLVGMVYRRPVNNVLANSLLRRALLHVAQQEAVLRQLEHEATHDLRQAYIVVAATRQRRELQQARVEAARARLKASEEQYRARKLGQVDYLLRAQEAHTDAELSRARAIIEERKAIEQWNFERGSILCGGVCAPPIGS